MKFKAKLVEDFDQPQIDNSWIVEDYKKFACVESVDKNNINQEVVNKICAANYLEESIVMEELLKEATLGDEAEKVAKDIDADIINANEPKDEVFDELDRALATAKRQAKRGRTDGFSNILLVGPAGTGKTSRVKQWAAQRGINLYIRKAMDLDITDMGGAITPDKEGKKVNRLTSREWDPLDRPNSVLFLDELNRASSDVRGQLLTLVNNHTISDINEPSGERFLPNFLFTVAAINPANADYATDELDDAEYDRFKRLDITLNKAGLKKFLHDGFEKDLQSIDPEDEDYAVIKGQQALADTLLGDKTFRFDDVQTVAKDKQNGQTKHLSPRTFEAAINNCDGTKADLLKVWSKNCGQSSYSMVERILKNYKDIDDKANSVFKDEEEEEIFKKPQSNMDKIWAELGKQGQ